MTSEPELTAFSSDEEIEKALTQARATKLQIQRRVEAKKQRANAAERKQRTHILVKIGARWCAANGWQTNTEDLDYLDELMEKNEIDFYSPGAM